MKNIIKIFIMVTLLLAFNLDSLHAVSVGNPVSDDIEELEKDFEGIADEIRNIQEKTTFLENGQLKEYVNNVKAKVSKNKLNVIGDINKLDYDGAVAVRYNEDDSIIVNIPFKIANKDPKGPLALNNLAIVYDSEFNIINYTETNVKETAKSYEYYVYSDGKEVKKGEVEKGIEFGDYQTNDYWDNVVSCMNKLGISTETALLLAEVCGTICVVSVGTLCIQCVSAYLGYGAASAAWCLVSA